MTQLRPLTHHRLEREPATQKGLVRVACCVDDRYVKGLAVTLRSAADNLDDSHRLHVHLVDGGMSEAERERLESTCADAGITIERHEIMIGRLSELPISHHISHTAYIRLLLAEILPDEIDRVLYLDSDLLVLDDLSELFDQSLDGYWCGAIPDIACPVLDAPLALDNAKDCGPYLATFRPIPNYDEFGFQPQQPYFNSGVLLIDLQAWRDQELAERFLDCLEQNRQHIWCWDQYALNVVLSERWKVLPLKWNCGGHLYEYPSLEATPIATDQCREAFETPSIVHFTTKDKPWHVGHQHPHVDTFFRYLDRTAWGQWRPDPKVFRVKDWWSWRCEQWQKQGIIAYRKWQLRNHKLETAG